MTTNICMYVFCWKYTCSIYIPLHVPTCIIRYIVFLRSGTTDSTKSPLKCNIHVLTCIYISMHAWKTVQTALMIRMNSYYLDALLCMVPASLLVPRLPHLFQRLGEPGYEATSLLHTERSIYICSCMI